MKKSIMVELFNGNTANAENLTRSEEQRKYDKESLAKYEELEKTLSDQQKEQLEKLMDIECYVQGAAEENCFIEGFKLGLRLGIEAMDE